MLTDHPTAPGPSAPSSREAPPVQARVARLGSGDAGGASKTSRSRPWERGRAEISRRAGGMAWPCGGVRDLGSPVVAVHEDVTVAQLVGVGCGCQRASADSGRERGGTQVLYRDPVTHRGVWWCVGQKPNKKCAIRIDPTPTTRPTISPPSVARPHSRRLAFRSAKPS